MYISGNTPVEQDLQPEWLFWIVSTPLATSSNQTTVFLSVYLAIVAIVPARWLGGLATFLGLPDSSHPT